MYGVYTPILILQAFCIYHAYRHNAEQRWFWLIVLLPVAGSVIYLVHTFSNRRVISGLAENVKLVVNSNHWIEELEKAYEFSDNLKNRLNLADAYTGVARYGDAIALYEGCLQGFMADDPAVRIKLLQCFFLNGEHHKVVGLGNDLESQSLFKNSEARVAYAWSLFHTAQKEHSSRVFESLDISFTNHYQRLEYCKFLLIVGQSDSAKTKLEALLAESRLMQATERRLKRNVMREVKELMEHHFAAT